MDSILTWNIRGLNSPNKQEDIKDFLSKQQVGLVALLETNDKQKKIVEVATRLFTGYNWCTNVDFNPKVRIWVAWKGKACQVQIVTVTE